MAPENTHYTAPDVSVAPDNVTYHIVNRLAKSTHSRTSTRIYQYDYINNVIINMKNRYPDNRNNHMTTIRDFVEVGRRVFGTTSDPLDWIDTTARVAIGPAVFDAFVDLFDMMYYRDDTIRIDDLTDTTRNESHNDTQFGVTNIDRDGWEIYTSYVSIEG